jgi:VWFA-related protein
VVETGAWNMSKMLLNRGLLLAIFMFASVTMGIQSAAGQNQSGSNQEASQEQFKIAIDVNLVTTDVTVIGGSKAQLRAEDFIVYDEHIAQEITYFSYDLIPLAVAVLIDRSGSVAPHMPMLQLAALLSLRHLRLEDQVALFSFADGTKKICDLTEDRLQIAEKINQIKAEGGTDIYDAIRDAARYLSKEAPDRRRAIILVSDNCHDQGRMRKKEEQARNMKIKAERARKELLETGAALYSIRTPYSSSIFSGSRNPWMNNPWAGSNLCAESNDLLKNMTKETGGRLLVVGASTSLQKSLETAILNLRFRYTLGFNPSNPGEEGSFHRLTVKLNAPDRCPGCQLLVRSGYYTGIPADPPSEKPVQSSQPDSAQTIDETLIQRSILTAGSFAQDLPDISFNIRTAEQRDSNGRPLLLIDFYIEPAEIEIIEGANQYRCLLHVVIFYADNKGKILGYDWKKYGGDLSKDSYHRLIRDGIHGSTTIPLKDEVRVLKIVVYDEESNKIGSKLVRLPE